LVFALLLGRWIQARQQRWSTDAVELLFSLTPTSARLVEDDGVREVPIESIQPGQVVEIRAGDSVPVDGVVIEGASSIDQSLLTGESRPIAVQVGHAIAAAAVNMCGPLRVRVQATGENTRVGRLMRLVQECAERRAPIVRLADRLAGWFVPIMLGLSALTAGVWLILEPAHAIDNAVALLIVTCPCALGLATPLAVTVAIGRAARRRLLIKGGDVIERLAKPGTLLLDKTGTITEGKLAVVRWIGRDEIKAPVAAIESQSSHPIAMAVARSLGAQDCLNGSQVVQIVGQGITGRINGEEFNIGSPRFVRGQCPRDHIDSTSVEQALIDDGLTPVLVGVSGCIEAAIGLGDPIRDDASVAIEQLRKWGGPSACCRATTRSLSVLWATNSASKPAIVVEMRIRNRSWMLCEKRWPKGRW
jgi:Cu2+-exporting ATPase